MATSLLIDLHFLPSLEYFCVLQRADQIVLEKHEHFVKQSYRSRCYINTAQGVEMLSIPLTEKGGKTAIANVKIDYSQRWQNHHWRTIESAYRKAPFFEHYESGFRKILFSNVPFLFDLNSEILSFCLQSLKWSKSITSTSSYLHEIPLDMKDLRSAIGPKKPYQERSFYRPTPYYQVFGSTFAGNLSILDLLFCEGPRASAILNSSQPY
jgi:hypothetical protein